MAIEIDNDFAVDEKVNETVDLPSKYKVVMMNDDHTPMEWVVDLLVTVFKHSDSSAKGLTMEVHTEGSAVVGVYSFEVAEQKSVEAMNASRNLGFELMVNVEEE